MHKIFAQSCIICIFLFKSYLLKATVWNLYMCKSGTQIRKIFHMNSVKGYKGA